MAIVPGVPVGPPRPHWSRTFRGPRLPHLPFTKPAPAWLARAPTPPAVQGRLATNGHPPVGGAAWEPGACDRSSARPRPSKGRGLATTLPPSSSCLVRLRLDRAPRGGWPLLRRTRQAPWTWPFHKASSRKPNTLAVTMAPAPDRSATNQPWPSSNKPRKPCLLFLGTSI